MEYKEARAKLIKMAMGDPCSLTFKEVIFTSIHEEQECFVYIQNVGIFSGATWEEAFERLEEALTDPNR